MIKLDLTYVNTGIGDAFAYLFLIFGLIMLLMLFFYMLNNKYQWKINRLKDILHIGLLLDLMKDCKVDIKDVMANISLISESEFKFRYRVDDKVMEKLEKNTETDRKK